MADISDLTTIKAGDKVILTGMGYDPTKVYTVTRVTHDMHARLFAGNTLCTYVTIYAVNHRTGVEGKLPFFTGFGQPHGRDLRVKFRAAE